MPREADRFAKKLLEQPGSILPERAMRHVKKAQKEMEQAMAEISKFADPQFVKRHRAEFKKLAKALYPACSSGADFSKAVTQQMYRELHKMDVYKGRAVLNLERRLRGVRRPIDETSINKTRTEIMGKIRNMITSGEFGVPGRVAWVWPAAAAAVAAAVVAVVEVVTLVRSVVSSSYVDRLIRTHKLNPRLIALRGKELLPSARFRGGEIR